MKQLRTSPNGREQRVGITATLSLRKKGDAPPIVEGYGALFGHETVINTRSLRFREVIAPGAFGNSIANDDIRVAFNHDANFIVGRTSAKTATVTENSTGLQYSAEPPDTAWARDMVTSIQRRDITGSSFQFEVLADDDEEWDFAPMKDGQLPLRTIKRAKLFEVGPVAFPAYDTTTVSARAIERVTEAQTDLAIAAPARTRRDLEKAKAELRCCMDSYYLVEEVSWTEACRSACARCIAECAWCISVCAAMVNDPTAGVSCAACLAACRTCLDACTACLTACAAGDEPAAVTAAAACQAACAACAPLCSACAIVCAAMPQSEDAMACMSECQYCSSTCAACVAACAARPTADGGETPRAVGAPEQRAAEHEHPATDSLSGIPDLDELEAELHLLERDN